MNKLRKVAKPKRREVRKIKVEGWLPEGWTNEKEWVFLSEARNLVSPTEAQASMIWPGNVVKVEVLIREVRK